MPQADFYLCERDLLDVAALLFGGGGSLVPDLDYKTPDLRTIRDVEDLRRVYRELNPQLFFGISPKWQRAPLTIRGIEKDDRTVFFILQKNGGPSIDIFCPQPFIANGRLAVAHGFIGYHRCYWNPISGQMEPTPEALKDVYHALRSQLAQGGLKISGKNREIIVTKNTQNSGLALIGLKKGAQEFEEDESGERNRGAE